MTSIEWTQRPGTKGETWNPIRARDKATGKIGWFCVHVSEGCRNCYAEGMNLWRGNGVRYRAQDRDKVEVFLDLKALVKPLGWRKPRTVFPCSMTDLFEPGHHFEMIDKVVAVMSQTPQHTYQVLTKRPGRAGDYFGQVKPGAETAALDLIDFPLPNVWFGASVENKAALHRIDELRAVPAAKRFLSIEPLLEDLGELDLTGIDMVIVGGESGPWARPLHPDWVRSIRDQCLRAGVAFFFKQWGEWRPPERPQYGQYTEGQKAECGRRRIIMGGNGHVRGIGAESFYDDDVIMVRVGKQAAGAELDGREWREFAA